MKMNNSKSFLGHYNHYIVMFFIMIFAGLLSTINTYANKLDDIRFSLNDLYMIFQMTGLMLLFMGIYYSEMYVIIFGALLSTLSFIFIRNQYFIDETQYLLCMIPHHSMAVLMSKRLLEKKNNIKDFLENIVNTQFNEINFMKNKLRKT